MIKINFIILTHAHDDHFSGLQKVLEKYRVGQIIQGRPEKSTPAYESFLRAEKNNGAKIIRLSGGGGFRVGDCRVSVIAPLPEAKDENDRSLVTKIICNRHSFLLAGDLGLAGQKALRQKKFSLVSEFYKASHHGADKNNQPDLINLIDPKTIIITVGKNSFGHPGKNFLREAANSHRILLRTDTLGTISFIISSKGVKIHNFK